MSLRFCSRMKITNGNLKETKTSWIWKQKTKFNELNEDWRLFLRSIRQQWSRVLQRRCQDKDLLEIIPTKRSKWTKNKNEMKVFVFDKLFVERWNWSLHKGHCSTICKNFFLKRRKTKVHWGENQWKLPSDFTCRNIHSAFWHHAYSSLRIRRWIRVDIMNVRSFRCIFKISNCWIALREKDMKKNIENIFVVFTFPQRKIKPVSSS